MKCMNMLQEREEGTILLLASIYSSLYEEKSILSRVLYVVKEKSN